MVLSYEIELAYPLRVLYCGCAHAANAHSLRADDRDYFLIYINHNSTCGRSQSGREMHQTPLQITGNAPPRRAKVIRGDRTEAQ
jgi:hypothetical protein